MKKSLQIGRSVHQRGYVTKDDYKQNHPRTTSEYILGMSVGVFMLNQMNSFTKNLRTQLWQSKIIEFSSYAAQEDTYMMNDWSREPGSDGTYLAPDSKDGYLESRYINGEANESASFWKFGESLVMSGAVWVTDYVEVGPADCFEYINGMLNGVSLAKMDYGMYPTCMDSPTTIVTCLQKYTSEYLGRQVPDWMINATRLTMSPAFKGFWFSYLFVLGSMISVLSELFKACTMSTLVGGLAGTAISLGASSLTQKTWSGINQATIESLSDTGLSDDWTYYLEGDDGTYWRIKAYNVMKWLYDAGSTLRPEGAFFEVFYLSTYFPNIGAWAGAFDSMLPFIVLSSVGAGLILTYLVSILTPMAVASGALTAGIGTLIVMAVIALTFIVLRVLKALGLFKKRDPSTIGDD